MGHSSSERREVRYPTRTVQPTSRETPAAGSASPSERRRRFVAAGRSSISRQQCCWPQKLQAIDIWPRRNIARLRFSVLSWVSRCRPVVAQLNWILACTRIVALRTHSQIPFLAYLTVGFSCAPSRGAVDWVAPMSSPRLRPRPSFYACFAMREALPPVLSSPAKRQ